MDRNSMITGIKSLFPPDSEYLETAVIGRRLMAEAVEEIGWEKLPEEMIKAFHDKCVNEEMRQTNQFLNRRY